MSSLARTAGVALLKTHTIHTHTHTQTYPDNPFLHYMHFLQVSHMNGRMRLNEYHKL